MKALLEFMHQIHVETNLLVHQVHENALASHENNNEDKHKNNNNNLSLVQKKEHFLTTTCPHVFVRTNYLVQSSFFFVLAQGSSESVVDCI